jgi:hypothetical protein
MWSRRSATASDAGIHAARVRGARVGSLPQSELLCRESCNTTAALGRAPLPIRTRRPVKPITRTELKRFLNDLPKDRLVNQVVDLWATLPQVQDYYEAKVRPGNDEHVRQKYRAIVEREFYPARGLPKMKLSVARKAVMDYKKIAASAEGAADLMIYYVETGVRFTNDYGDIGEAFYSSMAGMYASALEWIAKHDLKPQFEQRCAAIVQDSYDCGYGFYDDVSAKFEEFFGTMA